MTRHLHRARSTIRLRRRPVDLAKPTPVTAVGDCVTLQLLGEAQAVGGEDSLSGRALPAVEVVDGVNGTADVME